MSRYRPFALLAALVAMLAAMVGVALTPGSASAAPNYPPPPPSMVVNKGTVKAGVTVKATGRYFRGKEPVYVTVTFTAKGSKKSKVVKKATVTANAKGQIVVTVKMSAPGTAVITGNGTKSKKSASASVHVIAKYKGGGWTVKPASFTGGPTGTSVLTPVSATSGGAGVALAALGAMALIGSAVITRRTVRRRRQAGAAA